MNRRRGARRRPLVRTSSLVVALVENRHDTLHRPLAPRLSRPRPPSFEEIPPSPSVLIRRNPRSPSPLAFIRRNLPSSGVTRRGDRAAKTRPIQSTPFSRQASTSSSRVIPQIFTSVAFSPRSSRRARAGSGARSSDSPTRNAPKPAAPSRSTSASRLDPALGDARDPGRQETAEARHAREVDRERREVAGVDADEFRAQRRGPPNLALVVGFDEDREAARLRRGVQRGKALRPRGRRRSGGRRRPRGRRRNPAAFRRRRSPS